MKFMTCIIATLLVANSGLAITDIHRHVSSNGAWGDPISILSEMQKNQIDSSVIISSAYAVKFFPKLGGTTMQQENDYVAAVGAKYPDKLIPACSVPLFDPDTLGEIDRCGAVLQIKFLKLHTLEYFALETGIDNPDFTKAKDFKVLSEILRAAAKNKMTVLFHSSFLTAEELFVIIMDSITKKYAKDLKLVLMHGLDNTNYKDLHTIVEFRQWAERSKSDFPEIYIELSDVWTNFPLGSPFRDDWIEQVKFFGLQWTPFGTDDNVEGTINTYRELFSEQELSVIFNDNFKKVYTEKK